MIDILFNIGWTFFLALLIVAGYAVAFCVRAIQINRQQAERAKRNEEDRLSEEYISELDEASDLAWKKLYQIVGFHTTPPHEGYMNPERASYQSPSPADRGFRRVDSVKLRKGQLQRETDSYQADSYTPSCRRNLINIFEKPNLYPMFEKPLPYESPRVYNAHVPAPAVHVFHAAVEQPPAYVRNLNLIFEQVNRAPMWAKPVPYNP
eukprot:TRINITY_DN8292_c0_g1_i1.p1 TRINITY_DN8292_c0_g1~~TRINITY_DN8292_c0_g1_i1.p1  ORF type:complete len:207 (-),score=24.24 TRINITY_DN8292_c0_g1_i1:1706-2326(-)